MRLETPSVEGNDLLWSLFFWDMPHCQWAIGPDVSRHRNVLISKGRILMDVLILDETNTVCRNVWSNRPVTRHHVPEDRRPQLHRCESLKLA